MRRVIARIRNGGGRVCCGGRDEVNTAGVSRQSSGQGLGDATRRLGDEREDVVMVVLKKADNGEGCTPVCMCGPCVSAQNCAMGYVISVGMH